MRKTFNVEQRSARWHELRQKSIGGSDVSVLFGMNKYKDTLELWRDKVGLSKIVDISDQDDVRRGIVLEDLAFELLLKHEDFAGYQACNAPMFVDDNNHMHHSPDGIIAKSLDGHDEVLVEIKVPRPTRIAAITDNGPDLSWIMQVQHGLHCCELERGVLAVLDVQSMRLVLFHINRNDSVVTRIKTACKSFFDECVIPNEPPHTWSPSASIEGADIAMPSDDVGKDTVFLSDDGAVAEYIILTQEKKRVEDELKEAKKVVEAFFAKQFNDGTGVIVTSDGKRIKRYMCKGRASIDTKTLQAENPDLPWERYTKPAGSYPAMRVSGGKK